jgi:hypothetical protein
MSTDNTDIQELINQYNKYKTTRKLKRMYLAAEDLADIIFQKKKIKISLDNYSIVNMYLDLTNLAYAIDITNENFEEIPLHKPIPLLIKLEDWTIEETNINFESVGLDNIQSVENELLKPILNSFEFRDLPVWLKNKEETLGIFIPQKLLHLLRDPTRKD